MASASSAQTLALCATPSDVAVFSERGASIVALTAAAADACEQRAVEYLLLPARTTSEEIAADRELVGRTLRAWIDTADGLIRSARPEVGRAFRPASGSHLVLWSLIGEVYAAAEALRSLLLDARPAGLAVRVPAGEVIPRDLAIRVPAPVLVAEDVAARLGIPIEAEPGESLAPGSDGGGFRLATAVRRIASVIKQGALRRRNAAETSVLVVGGGYDLAPVVDELIREGVDVAFASPMLALDRQLAPFVGPDVSGDPRLAETLAPLGIERLSFTATMLDAWWTSYVPALWDAFLAARRSIAGRRPVAVLAAEAGGGTAASAVLQAGEAAGARRVIYQHGSSVVLDATVWEGWLDNADELLVYGEGTRALLRQSARSYFAPACVVRPVGSARLDRPNRPQRAAGDDRTVLYVPALFGTYGRLLGDLAAYPDVAYYSLQRRVLGLFAGRHGTRLIYKVPAATNAHENPIPAFLASTVPGASVVDAPSPARLAGTVDAVIVDHAVTALAEVLVTRTPAIVYVPASLVMLPEMETGLELLRRRATVATDEPGFVAAVQAFLESGRIDGDPDDRSFVRRYVTNLDDCGSTSRAVDAILRA